MDSNKAVSEDCNAYLHTLSAEEQNSAGPILYYEDGTGQHAVRIIIGINGEGWEHILFYSKDNKRVKAIKYLSGHYRS
jgi:hypothetical protein